MCNFLIIAAVCLAGFGAVFSASTTPKPEQAKPTTEAKPKNAQPSQQPQQVNPFAKAEIAPDVIPVPPPHLVKIEYPKSHKMVTAGNELAPKDVLEAPTVSYEGEPNTFYTLIMTDPDAPSRKNPVQREWNHWLVVNIPGSDIAKGETITEYVGSAPPKDTGMHRYVFLLFKQAGKIKVEEPKKTKTDGKRGKFSTKEFAQKYHLEEPVAGNFFEAKYDESVPATHKQLGF